MRFSVVATAVRVEMTGGESERLAEGNGAKVLDFEMAGHSEDAAGAVGFAHGFVEEGGDDAAVGVAGRSGKAAGEAEVADDVFVGIDEEFEAKAGGVIEPAAEAVIEGSVGQRSESGLGWWLRAASHFESVL